MRVIYRILILIAIFVTSVLYFGSSMPERTFRAENETITMSESTLPVVVMRVDGEKLNLLHGYCSNLDEMLMRESITPLTPEKHFEVLITENEYNIKKVTYEVVEVNAGEKVEEGSVISLEKETDESGAEYRTAKVRLKNEYTTGQEYVVKLTLISNESKRIYYYTRIKVLPKTYLAEKLDFVEMFHQSLLNKESASNVKKYLETDKKADETDFSRATLKNSLDFLSYGALAPEVIYTELPTMTECTQDTASVVLGFWVKLQTGTGVETYYVKEAFRFQYTAARTYVYNYERTMEAEFDVKNTSLAKSEFKLGITSKLDSEVLVNKDNTRIAFVRNGSLYMYTAADNLLTTVFSFREKETDYLRDVYDKHDIRLLSIDDTGALDFLVYGYMNRGEYEGRVAMILYTYYPQSQSVEERAYFPVNTTYDILKETLGEFAYCNSQEIFYFHAYHTIYSYNMITETLSVIAEQVYEDALLYSEKMQMLAWQESENGRRKEEIRILDLETGKQSELYAASGRIIGLLGMIDTNLILGNTTENRTWVREDGTVVVAYEKAEIVDFSGKKQKTYEKAGYYVTDVQVEKNVITLLRATENAEGRYEAAEPDYILNQATAEKSAVTFSERVTEQMRREYYLSLPEGVQIASLPKQAGTENVVITEDVTVRINIPEYFQNYYLAYAYGEVRVLSMEPGEAILLADKETGSVIDSRGRICWSRGVKTSSTDLGRPAKIERTSDCGNSLMACVQMLLNYRNIEADVLSYHPEREPLTDWMERYLKQDTMKLTGVTLDEALYYVYRKTPVIAVNEKGTAILIFSYDSNGIMAAVPDTGKQKRYLTKEAESFLGETDYYFIVIGSEI